MVFIWVILYGLISSLTARAAANYGLAWLVPAGLLVYDGLFVRWLAKWEKQRWAGIRLPVFQNGEDWIYAAALALLPACNLLGGNLSVVTVSFAVQMFCVAFTEELFFRGILQPVLSRGRVLPGILLSSLVFAMMHGANFFVSEERCYVWMQIAGAFAAGICYGAARVRWGSILPGTAAHFLTNVTAAGVLTDRMTVILWLGIAVQALMGLWMCIRLWDEERKMKDCPDSLSGLHKKRRPTFTI